MGDMDNIVGIVGSPSTTNGITVDILGAATSKPLYGQLVYLQHPLENNKVLVALGTITEIKTINRWHEDPNMRGVLKMHGNLPHLSEVGDIRTAEILIQATYTVDNNSTSRNEPIEDGASLSMSPTTGSPVIKVTNNFLQDLLRRHTKEITYLGHIYRSDVRLPFIIQHFGLREEGGAGQAYHTGIFGMSGSGKSVLTAYLIAAQLRHPKMSVFIIDPQGQFTSEEGLPFSLKEWAERLGRTVRAYSIVKDLQLPKDAPLLTDLLGLTNFFRDILVLKNPENRKTAIVEFQNAIKNVGNWQKDSAVDVLKQTFKNLLENGAIERIYATQDPQNRLKSCIQDILDNKNGMFDYTLRVFQPIHSLFTRYNSQRERRTPLVNIFHNTFLPDVPVRPFTIIDLSDIDYDSNLDNVTVVKAKILQRICSVLERMAGEMYKKGGLLNTLVVFDEAHRFASQFSENEEVDYLSHKLVDYVRTTRKYGLGWTFITQSISSLRREIFDQLRIRCFGYGLTSGAELTRLRELIGDSTTIDLYRSFVDPDAAQSSQYPFMVTGPASPLSFTGMPVFLSVYTDFNTFCADNGISGFGNNFHSGNNHSFDSDNIPYDDSSVPHDDGSGVVDPFDSDFSDIFDSDFSDIFDNDFSDSFEEF